MINERLKRRLQKDRSSITITMRIPEDVVDSLKAIAPMRGFAGYQTLLKSYISEGLRRDEAQFDQHTALGSAKWPV
jgi:predicted DNA binding CopG/RHH family protein